jgi:hypothetical protein
MLKLQSGDGAGLVVCAHYRSGQNERRRMRHATLDAHPLSPLAKMPSLIDKNCSKPVSAKLSLIESCRNRAFQPFFSDTYGFLISIHLCAALPTDHEYQLFPLSLISMSCI